MSILIRNTNKTTTHRLIIYVHVDYFVSTVSNRHCTKIVYTLRIIKSLICKCNIECNQIKLNEMYLGTYKISTNIKSVPLQLL